MQHQLERVRHLRQCNLGILAHYVNLNTLLAVMLIEP